MSGVNKEMAAQAMRGIGTMCLWDESPEGGVFWGEVYHKLAHMASTGTFTNGKGGITDGKDVQNDTAGKVQKAVQEVLRTRRPCTWRGFEYVDTVALEQLAKTVEPSRG